MRIILCLLVTLLTKTCYPQECPSGYENHPLVLVSLDGFRAEYLQRGLTPNIQKLIDEGTSTPHMIPSFPTLTFPNHYTIVTGLNPESHGIVANHFYDPEFDDEFFIGDKNGTWWGGEPIWNTVVLQDKKSATMFWPGSDADIEGIRPTYYYDYDGTVPFQTRVEQVLLWLSLPESSRPEFICVYFDEPDHTGHSYGPDSDEVNDILVEVDLTVASLVEGIAKLNITDCVNLIIISDHGMTPSSADTAIELTDYVPDLENMAYTYEGAFVQIDIYDEFKNETDSIRGNLTNQNPNMRQYNASGLPKRLHYSRNRRIGDIILSLNLGYAGNVNSDFFLSGQHGYDNKFQDMQAIFIASGPEFQKGQFEPFQNIELYNLMSLLLGVTPASNNGTEASLNHLLLTPPTYPTLQAETPPSSPIFPNEDEIDERMHLSGCPGDDNAPLSQNYSSIEEDNLRSKHLPLGIPLSGNLPAEFLLLYQLDHVTGYSQTLKMPLWTSFDIDSDIFIPPVLDWSSDVRLNDQNTPTCDAYDLLLPNVTMQPLFPNELGRDGVVNFIVSNAVPMHEQLKGHWDYLVSLLYQWIIVTPGEINVITGPAFDQDADSLVDNIASFNSDVVSVPSHMFLIATRCNSTVDQLIDCAPEDLDSLAFIYPQYIDIENTLTPDDYALDKLAKVRDVEIITGLTFYPDLPYKERTQLATRIHTSLWEVTKYLS